MKSTKYFHFDPATGSITGVGFTPDGTIPSDCIACTDVQADSPENFQVDISANPPSVIPASQAQIDAVLAMKLRSDARSKLDIVTGPRGQAIRAFVAGIQLTTDWQAYITTLRAIANGTDTTSTSLPVQPAYIQNT